MLQFLAVPALAVAGGAFYLSRLPKHYSVLTSLTVQADRQSVFDTLRDLRTWREWSPWLLHDPDAKLAFGEDPDQPGGYYAWDGRYGGAGWLTHDRFDPPGRIEQTIDFRRPFEAQASMSWELVETDGGTEITWRIAGEMPLLLRPKLPKMREMIAWDQELGLVQLRSQLDPKAERPAISFDGATVLPSRTALTIPFRGEFDARVRATKEGIPKLSDHLAAQGLVPSDAPFTAYHHADTSREHFDCDIAMPAEETIAAGEFARKTFSGGKHFKVTLIGSYDFLELTWRTAIIHARTRRLKIDKSRPMLEVYEGGFQSVGKSHQTRTDLYMPLLR